MYIDISGLVKTEEMPKIKALLLFEYSCMLDFWKHGVYWVNKSLNCIC